MAGRGVGNQLTTSGSHLHGFAWVKNPIHALLWMFEGKAISASLKDSVTLVRRSQGQAF